MSRCRCRDVDVAMSMSMSRCRCPKFDIDIDIALRTVGGVWLRGVRLRWGCCGGTRWARFARLARAAERRPIRPERPPSALAVRPDGREQIPPLHAHALPTVRGRRPRGVPGIRAALEPVGRLRRPWAARFRARLSGSSRADPLQRNASVARSRSRFRSYWVTSSDNPSRVIISSLAPDRHFMTPRANKSDYGVRTGAAPGFDDLYVTARVVADHKRRCPVTRLPGLFRWRRGTTSRKKDEKGQNGGPRVPWHIQKSSLRA
jgi:hypothetical protein